MGLISVLEKIGQAANEIADAIEAEEKRKRDQRRPQESKSKSVSDAIVHELRHENEALRKQRDRRDETIADLLAQKDQLRREISQQKSTQEAMQARIEQLSEPSTKHVMSAGEKEELRSLRATVKDLQKQQESDVETLKKIHEAWPKLNRRPAPTSGTSLARRLTEFAKATGLDRDAGKEKRK